MQNILLRIGNFLFRRPKFKKWCFLEEEKYEIARAVEQGDGNLYQPVYQYLSSALAIHPRDYSKIYWKDVIETFVSVHNVTVPSKVLPLVSKTRAGKDQSDPWNYQGRLWFFYSNIIASAFSWTVKQIASLSINDALSYVQEILTDKQLEKEFIWSTSDKAYTYDKMTKKSKFNKLTRPYWMQKDFDKPTKKVPALPKELMPVGVVEKIKDKNATQKTQPARDNTNISAS